MPNIHEKFEYQGEKYCRIDFKVSPLARDVIIHYYRNGFEIAIEAYEEARAEYKKAFRATLRAGG